MIKYLLKIRHQILNILIHNTKEGRDFRVLKKRGHMKSTVGGQYRPLTEGGIKKILEVSFTILSEIGVEVHKNTTSAVVKARELIG